MKLTNLIEKNLKETILEVLVDRPDQVARFLEGPVRPKVLRQPLCGYPVRRQREPKQKCNPDRKLRHGFPDRTNAGEFKAKISPSPEWDKDPHWCMLKGKKPL